MPRKKKTKFDSRLLALLLVVAMLIIIFAPSTVPVTGLVVDGVSVKTPDGNPISLSGFNVEPRDMTEEGMQWLKSKGFNFVRVTFYWHRLEPQQGVYSNEYFGYLDNMLSWCEEYDIYANLVFMQWQWSQYFSYSGSVGVGFPRWVISPGGYPDSPEGLRDCYADFFMERNSHGVWMKQKFFDFWEYIINRYKDNPYVMSYEVINEPLIAKQVVHVEGVDVAVMDTYEEFTSRFRPLDATTMHVYHAIREGSERKVSDPNVAWIQSWYSVMYGGYYSSEYNQIVDRLTALKVRYNDNLESPFFISEIGFTTTNEASGGAEQWLRDSFSVMEQINLNDGYPCYGWWIYNKGVKYGFRTPRNSDGSDTWIVGVLQEVS